MTTYECKICNYTTVHANIYERHNRSQRHVIMQQKALNEAHKKVIQRNSSNIRKCCRCNKIYKSYSGLWKHTQICSQSTEVSISENPPMFTNENLFEVMTKINTKLDNIKPNTTINNTINGNINVYLNFLDTHCNNAINFDKFVETIEFVKEDFDEISKKRFYVQGANAILKRKMDLLPLTERPMHCAKSVVNKPMPFFIRENDEWKTECPALIEYMLNYGDFESDDEKMIMVKFLEKYNDKLFNAYTEICKTDPKWKKIEHEMNISGQSKTHIRFLNEMSDILVLDPQTDDVSNLSNEVVIE